MKAKTMRVLFLSGALFNWLAGLGLLFDARLLFELLGVSPLPGEFLFVQLFAWLVIVFGVGYFWASRNPSENIPIIKLGLLGKASVVLVCLASVALGAISWQLLILASVDLFYAILFWRALQALG